MHILKKTERPHQCGGHEGREASLQFLEIASERTTAPRVGKKEKWRGEPRGLKNEQNESPN